MNSRIFNFLSVVFDFSLMLGTSILIALPLTYVGMMFGVPVTNFIETSVTVSRTLMIIMVILWFIHTLCEYLSTFKGDK